MNNYSPKNCMLHQGMILGNAVASSLFGEMNVVTADYSRYEGRDDSDIGSPANAPKHIYSEHPINNENDENVCSDSEPEKVSIASLQTVFIETNNSDVGYSYARELSSFRERTKEFNMKELATRIHMACDHLKKGEDELQNDAHSSLIVGMLANSCRELSAELVQLEYELRRLEWRKPVTHPTQSSSSSSSSSSSTITTTTTSSSSSTSKQQNQLANQQPAFASRTKGHSSGQKMSLRLPDPNALKPFKSAEEEELWVMDQLDGLLSRSRFVTHTYIYILCLYISHNVGCISFGGGSMAIKQQLLPLLIPKVL
jgi:hypothetical protein